MTSQRQTDANRRNALLSTGPQTKDGKRRSRQNAFRHGLAAETVVVGLEDAAAYRAFEAKIIAEYNPRSVIERELTYRLASLLWRLRRASFIETGLLRIQSEILQSRNRKPDLASAPDGRVFTMAVRWLSMVRNFSHSDGEKEGQNDERPKTENGATDASIDLSSYSAEHSQRVMTCCFLRLANLNNEPFERIGRYEAILWRQFSGVLFALSETSRRRITELKHRFAFQDPQS